MSETPQSWMEKFSTAQTPDQALEYLDSALALDPDFVPALGCKGTLLGQLQRHEEALMCFARISELQPKSGAAHYSIGLHLQALGRDQDALVAYSKAIEVAPDEADAYVNRGRLRDETGDPEQAIVDYDAALRLQPNDSVALSNRGNSLMGLERFDEALASFDSALEADASNVPALLGRSTVLMSLGRIDEANAARPEGTPLDRGPVVELRKGLPTGKSVVLCYYPQVHSNPEHLERAASQLLDYVVGLQGQGPGLGDGIRIGFMWSMITLRERGSDLVLCEPAFGRHPFSELSYDVSFTLQTAVMSQLLHSITELPRSECTFAEGIAMAPMVVLEDALEMYRLHDTNEQHISGWVIGAGSRDAALKIIESKQYDMVPTAALINLRQSAVKVLSLPAGCTVKMQEHKLTSVLDPQGREVWQQEGS
ncbi:MAG: tetratricopeptide repeat protein [Myxococcales bacterium]|nr:tetratricopeptide repeat protein [Myxococcales bacterium]